MCRWPLVISPDDPNPDTEPNLVYYFPTNTSANSTYQRNVVAVLEFLYKHNPPDGYAASLGYGGYATCLGYSSFPHAVYAHSGCYNMSDQPSCGQCIQDAYMNIQSVLWYATGGVIWINQTFQRSHEIRSFQLCDRSCVQHRNLVVQGDDRFLVYEFLEQGSLAWNLSEAGRLDECVDERVGNDYVARKSTERFTLLCFAPKTGELRPAMGDVLAMLLGYLDLGSLVFLISNR
ncbi:hypothetical protein SELMODRAFT_409789 [Selaginella moellendorffii]|uniref:Gnk2-homologous domain-containing protein n=1 Tax=Selaginella moellendorffii TaxID=88036 RepID=D8RCG5_SELML|nr:hypothetical protein SELMODRAFT_409789 [Selaginella moellendorffii]